MNLFCFPYAGGSSVIFNKWQAHLGSKINVKPYELAGRGLRFSETNYKNLNETVNEIINNIEGDIKNKPYSLFGHSMGSTIVFALMNELRERHLREPNHIFFSGAKPPCSMENNTNFHLMNDDDFINELKKYRSTPEEFFDNDELLELFLPRLKNDFALANSINIPLENFIPFNVEISVLFGDKENNYSQKEAMRWNKYSSKKCNIFRIKGSHFFINENPTNVLLIVKEMLSQYDYETYVL